MTMTEEKWSKWRILSYSMGHTFNDMCAALWFSYLLVFLHEAVGLSPVQSGIVMLYGQIADGLATPLVGVLSDATNGCPSLGFGPRKSWHVCGSLINALSLYMVFGQCSLNWFVKDPSDSALVIYYCVWAVLLNIGWAAVQVAHMSLVPELTACNSLRCVLTSGRYGFTIISNVLVFCTLGFLLQHVAPQGKVDENKFSLITTFVVVVGTLAVLGFLTGTKESARETRGAEEVKAPTPVFSPADMEYKSRGPVSAPFEATSFPVNEEEMLPLVQTSTPKRWYEWFKDALFYKVAVVYMCARLFINIVQVMMPFFLLSTIHLSATNIAAVPLVTYLAGFLTTFFINFLSSKIGRNNTFILGGLVGIGALVCCFLLTDATALWIYPLAMLIGSANSILMIVSVCMEADVVGTATEGTAFVYGAMSLTDKFSNGLAIMVIQGTRQSIQDSYGINSAQDGYFVRLSFCLIPAGAALLGMFMTRFIANKYT